jgi:hypothetical protein
VRKRPAGSQHFQQANLLRYKVTFQKPFGSPKQNGDKAITWIEQAFSKIATTVPQLKSNTTGFTSSP